MININCRISVTPEFFSPQALELGKVMAKKLEKEKDPIRKKKIEEYIENSNSLETLFLLYNVNINYHTAWDNSYYSLFITSTISESKLNTFFELIFSLKTFLHKYGVLIGLDNVENKHYELKIDGDKCDIKITPLFLAKLETIIPLKPEVFEDFYYLEGENLFCHKSKIQDLDKIVTGDKYKFIDFASEIESEWSKSAISYLINWNSNFKIWKCTNEIIIYDGVTLNVFGYGFSYQEALQNCEDRKSWAKKQAMIQDGFISEIDGG